MAINPSANVNDLTSWLNQHLLSTNSFIPHINGIPNVKSKGIYFWFMRPEGYKALSTYASIKPIEPKYSKDVDGINYDLIYLGTTGTGKQGKSTIHDRLKWHINQIHGNGEIVHGTLSTFRAGLGALLADDLIIPDCESLVNSFLKQYMIVFWIEYPDNKSLIDNDEEKLIKCIMPLLNLKNNPNAKTNAKTNSTKEYKLRRTLVYKNSKLRLGI